MRQGASIDGCAVRVPLANAMTSTVVGFDRVRERRALMAFQVPTATRPFGHPFYGMAGEITFEPTHSVNPSSRFNSPALQRIRQ